MTTLITGGASRTGILLAKKLTASSHPVIFAVRSSPVPQELGPSVKLDWSDPSTFSNPFNEAHDIQSVYLLGQPFTTTSDESLIPFINLAIEKGVKKFVLLSSAADKPGPDSTGLGRVHTYLEEIKADAVILRPTWFIENFVGFFAASIKNNNTVQTVVRDGKISFVSVEDIAQAAYDAIVNPSSLRTKAPILIGCEFVSYSEVTAYLSTLLGRTITHTHISAQDQLAQYLAFGLTESYGRMLIEREEIVDQGDEERLREHPDAVVGKWGVKQWLEEHKEEVIARLS